MNSVITLEEYRERYPEAGSIRTLTQQGLVGLLMERLQQQSARQRRRRAMRQQLAGWLTRAFDWIYRT